MRDIAPAPTFELLSPTPRILREAPVAGLARGLSVVIPVYNGQPSLSDLIDTILPVVRDLADDIEVVLVNDGSRDESWELIQRLAEVHAEIRAINLMRNYGQHNALLAGIRAARYDTIVTLDDDLQHPPFEMRTLIAELEKGYDVVYGAPTTERHGLARNLASQITKLALQGAMGAGTARKVTAFRVFRTQLRDSFADYRGPFVSIDVLLTWGTARFGAVTVRHEPRAKGGSNYTVGKLFTHAMNMMTGFSTLPLQLASLIGFASTLFGLVVLVYVIGRYLVEGGSVPGFPFLVSLITLFAGAQLFSLGILGEYLARMHFRLMEKPSYAIRETIDGSG
jgi:glycosyltransferase involved in cell wall biosynthesis